MRGKWSAAVPASRILPRTQFRPVPDIRGFGTLDLPASNALELISCLNGQTAGMFRMERLTLGPREAS
jgi:hypothetical protein